MLQPNNLRDASVNSDAYELSDGLLQLFFAKWNHNRRPIPTRNDFAIVNFTNGVHKPLIHTVYNLR